jgi:sRNA-binding regulator protein Hfq
MKETSITDCKFTILVMGNHPDFSLCGPKNFAMPLRTTIYKTQWQNFQNTKSHQTVTLNNTHRNTDIKVPIYLLNVFQTTPAEVFCVNKFNFLHETEIPNTVT